MRECTLGLERAIWLHSSALKTGQEVYIEWDFKCFTGEAKWSIQCVIFIFWVLWCLSNSNTSG